MRGNVNVNVVVVKYIVWASALLLLLYIYDDDDDDYDIDAADAAAAAVEHYSSSVTSPYCMSIGFWFWVNSSQVNWFNVWYEYIWWSSSLFLVLFFKALLALSHFHFQSQSRYVKSKSRLSPWWILWMYSLFVLNCLEMFLFLWRLPPPTTDLMFVPAAVAAVAVFMWCDFILFFFTDDQTTHTPPPLTVEVQVVDRQPLKSKFSFQNNKRKDNRRRVRTRVHRIN